MANPDTVVAAPQRLTKQQLHAKLMRGWSRAIDNHGRGVFMDALDISSQGLTKQVGGSMPDFEMIDRAFDLEPTVIDDWLKSKGVRIVDRDAVCDSDDLCVLVSRLLHKLIAAEHPDSPGGRRIVPSEIFDMEKDLADLVRKATGLLDKAAAYRGDNVTDMRRAG
jgi:hypothetical protein